MSSLSVLGTIPSWVPKAITYVVIAAVVGELLIWSLRSLLVRAGARRSTLSSVTDVIRVAWILLAGFAVLSDAGFTSVLTVLTVSGVLGLTISLALQTTLSNMVSGVLLLRDRALRIGDEIAYSGVKGRVVRVALRNTWILTDDGQIAVMGNASLHSGPLVNYSAKERFPDLVDVGARSPVNGKPPAKP